MMMFDRRLVKNFGWLLMTLTLMFAAFGLINLYSASFYTGLIAFKKQLVWIAIGIVAMILVSFVNYNLFKRYALHIYIVSLLVLLAVFIFGKEVSGSRSWIAIGPVSIQPSEFVKIALILIIARFYHNDFEDGPFGLKDIIKPILLTLLVFTLILLQPDLGTSLVVLLIAGTLIVFMGIKRKTLIILIAALVVVSVPAWSFFLKGYQKERILTFIDPSIDPLGTGYNSIQSQIAVGSGRLIGKGFTTGTQSQLRFIPAQKTDFAFSVLAEEWGFLGAGLTLIIYFLLILGILDTASSAKDKFSMLVALGVAALFFWHTLINIGMVLGILPVIGVPLLIFSYGGSSVLTSFIAIGIVLGIKMRQTPVPKEDISLEKSQA